MAIIGMGRVGIRSIAAPAPTTSYLLDTYGGAAVGYSLRKLSSTYTGSAIRVRRSSDNTEQNIGFDGSGNLDTSALTSFVGAGDGFVTMWYDQSGAGVNVKQTNALGQPLIVLSGVIYTKNGKPAVYFSELSGQRYMDSTSSVGSLPAFTLAAVIFPIKRNNYDKLFTIGIEATDSAISYCMSNGGTAFDWQAGDFMMYGNGYTPLSPRIISNGASHPNNMMTQSFITMGTSNTKAFFNNVEIPYRVQLNGTPDINTGIFTLGNNDASAATQQFGGYIQELILFKVNRIADRTPISTNQNTYYSIY